MLTKWVRYFMLTKWVRYFMLTKWVRYFMLTKWVRSLCLPNEWDRVGTRHCRTLPCSVTPRSDVLHHDHPTNAEIVTETNERVFRDNLGIITIFHHKIIAFWVLIRIPSNIIRSLIPQHDFILLGNCENYPLMIIKYPPICFTVILKGLFWDSDECSWSDCIP